MRYSTLLLATVLCGVSAPALAQDDTAPPEPITVSGSVGLVSDYRFRGVSQSDQDMAVQGGLTITHESGFYVGTWGSNLSGWGTFGGSNMELDLIGGFKTAIGAGATLDVGLTWYMYPGGASKTDFAEPYVKLSGTLGPASVTAGIAYAPKQQALGTWYLNGASAAAGVYDNPGAKGDNTYVWGDAAFGIPESPITLKAHLGHSWGNDGLGPLATSVTPTGSYFDWSLGADVTYKALTFNVSYVDTSISNGDAAYLRPSFSKGQDGTGNIAGSTVVFGVSAAF